MIEAGTPPMTSTTDTPRDDAAGERLPYPPIVISTDADGIEHRVGAHEYCTADRPVGGAVTIAIYMGNHGWLEALLEPQAALTLARLIQSRPSVAAIASRAVHAGGVKAFREIVEKAFSDPVETWPTGWRESYPALAEPGAGTAKRRIIEALATLSTAPAQAEGWRSMALDDVAAERRRQVEVEGYTPDHDDEHKNGEIGRAAVAYALSAMKRYQLPIGLVLQMKGIIADIWPWREAEYKPRGAPNSTRRTLVKAGALIIAEIDRLDRLPAAPVKGGESG